MVQGTQLWIFHSIIFQDNFSECLTTELHDDLSDQSDGVLSLAEVQSVTRKDHRGDTIILSPKFQKVVKVVNLQNVGIEPHLALILDILPDPLIDEGVSILLWE